MDKQQFEGFVHFFCNFYFKKKFFFEENLRDQEVQLFAKITDLVFADQIFKDLAEKYPTHLPVFLAQLKRLHANSGKVCRQQIKCDLL